MEIAAAQQIAMMAFCARVIVGRCAFPFSPSVAVIGVRVRSSFVGCAPNLTLSMVRGLRT